MRCGYFIACAVATQSHPHQIEHTWISICFFLFRCFSKQSVDRKYFARVLKRICHEIFLLFVRFISGWKLSINQKRARFSFADILEYSKMCSVRSERIDRAPTVQLKTNIRISINIEQFFTLNICRQILRMAIVLCIKNPLEYLSRLRHGSFQSNWMCNAITNLREQEKIWSASQTTSELPKK